MSTRKKRGTIRYFRRRIEQLYSVQMIVGHKKYIAFIAETLFKSGKFLVSKE